MIHIVLIDILALLANMIEGTFYLLKEVVCHVSYHKGEKLFQCFPLLIVESHLLWIHLLVHQEQLPSLYLSIGSPFQSIFTMKYAFSTYIIVVYLSLCVNTYVSKRHRNIVLLHISVYY